MLRCGNGNVVSLRSCHGSMIGCIIERLIKESTDGCMAITSLLFIQIKQYEHCLDLVVTWPIPVCGLRIRTELRWHIASNFTITIFHHIFWKTNRQGLMERVHYSYYWVPKRFEQIYLASRSSLAAQNSRSDILSASVSNNADWK